MFRYEKNCHGCEKNCKLHSTGYWHYPQINDCTFHSIDRLSTDFEAVDTAERISTLCEFYGTTNQPSVTEKRFKIRETCSGCDMHCRIKAIASGSSFEPKIGNDLIPELRYKNQYDALIKAFDLVQYCAHRKTK
ncbi:MAG: hypothetical protein IKZ34_02760 [Alphaproteobacteria bacterium]|nr:hypothetical protein [Alphaproteobacteria bacterium]